MKRRRFLAHKSPHVVAISLILSPCHSLAENDLEEMVVTAVRTASPLEIVTDPKSPRQPLPANDGADYLKSIPGFSVIRKGGTDGDPLLRGMGGSRLSILVDGEVILGGCSNRMDPPTAYVFPETFDTIRVIKGPQSVRHGPGNSAGAVLFEQNFFRPAEPSLETHVSLLGASADRRDAMFDVTYSSPTLSTGISGTSASAGNYTDGDDLEVHSKYSRWSTRAHVTYTPSDQTRIELNATRSDGEAAYADRGVDGSKFWRENIGLKFAAENLNGVVQSVHGQVYYNYVDHVMDNYSLRAPTGMMANRMAMNPDRETTGGRLALSLAPANGVDLIVGLDLQRNIHMNRMTMNQDMVAYDTLARVEDARFDQIGTFAEAIYSPAETRRLIAGMRVDNWEVQDPRQVINISMMMSVPNPTAGENREESLTSGFVRYETDLYLTPSMPATVYAGIGRAERFPDYWEMIAKETEDSVSGLAIDPEQTNQIDIGVLFRGNRVSGSISAFYNRIDDYLMIQSGFAKPAMMGTRMASIVRNIDARSYGFELDATYRISDNWKVDLALASVRGTNETDDSPLAQLPPLESRLGVTYDNNQWSVGVLWRALASQDRIDPGKGNIVGQDIGPTASTNVISLNTGWRVTPSVTLTAGVDNLLNETYAEHVSRAGASIPGFVQTTRVNEPGRTAWLKAQFDF
ncbi:MAG: TonB-dependent copper receptor [Pseudomonadota bacterium]